MVLPEADAVVAMTGQSPDMQGVLDQVWAHLLPALTAERGPAGPWPASALPGPGDEVGDLRAVELGAAAITLVDDGPAVTMALGPAGAWTTTGAHTTARAWST